MMLNQLRGLTQEDTETMLLFLVILTAHCITDFSSIMSGVSLGFAVSWWDSVTSLSEEWHQ